MRKNELTGEQVDRIIRLRESGLSWLAIENETEKEKSKIPRRLARSVYLEWQQKTMKPERELIRRQAALEYFKEHVDLQVKMGEQLGELLYIGRLPVPTVGSEEYLSTLWNKDLLVETVEGIQPKVYSKENGDLSDNRALRQRNRLIFGSLRDHTKGKINWWLLDDWKAGWDGCQDALQVLKAEIDIKQSEKMEKPIESGKHTAIGGLMKFIYSQAKDRIKDEAVRILWQIMKDSLAQVDSMPAENIQVARELTDVLTGGVNREIKLPPRYEDVVESPVAVFIPELLSDILGSDGMRQLHDCLSKMAEAYRVLEERLNQLALRPLILNTRCGLCPV